MRFYRLDALRGLLALSIVWLHVRAVQGIYPWWGTQQLSVNAFIVLSGFVTALALVKRPRPWLAFFYERCWRIFPVYWACLFLTLALEPFYCGSINLPQLEAATAQHFWLQVLVHLPLCQGLVPTRLLPQSDLALLEPAWFCSLLLQFCLVAPWMVRHLQGPAGIKLLGASLLILLVPIHWRFFAYWSSVGAFLPQKFYLFVIGGLLYTYWPDFGKGSSPKPLVFLGQISYPLFLCHWPIVALVHRFLPDNALVIFSIATPVSILVAWGLHVALERPLSRRTVAVRSENELTVSSA
jgi:peptidoglycan/LPS O-acetylase OafA/YrhL